MSVHIITSLFLRKPPLSALYPFFPHFPQTFFNFIIRFPFPYFLQFSRLLLSSYSVSYSPFPCPFPTLIITRLVAFSSFSFSLPGKFASCSTTQNDCYFVFNLSYLCCFTFSTNLLILCCLYLLILYHGFFSSRICVWLWG